MLMSNDHAEQVADAARVLFPCRVGPAACEQLVNGTVTSTDKTELHWVACITAIAKDEDQASFAVLFRHFAPRVKAFLIKSGADEASRKSACRT
jgi:hypothetical protein